MKKQGINCELVNEYAKECVWRESENILKDQLYVFAKQHNKIFRLKDKVDFIISDSPLFLNLHYGRHMGPTFQTYVLEIFNQYPNINFYVNRTKKYNPKGRMQTEAESDTIAKEIHNLLAEYKMEYHEIDSNADVLTFMDLIVK